MDPATLEQQRLKTGIVKFANNETSKSESLRAEVVKIKPSVTLCNFFFIIITIFISIISMDL